MSGLQVSAAYKHIPPRLQSLAELRQPLTAAICTIASNFPFTTGDIHLN